MPKSLGRKKTSILGSLNGKSFFGDGWGVVVRNFGVDFGPSLSTMGIEQGRTSGRKGHQTNRVSDPERG
jgi:hypothetical protein